MVYLIIYTIQKHGLFTYLYYSIAWIIYLSILVNSMVNLFIYTIQ